MTEISEQFQIIRTIPGELGNFRTAGTREFTSTRLRVVDNTK